MSGQRPRIAIVGAGGFVGTRLVEAWHLSGYADVVPIVRRPASLARLARFPVEWRLADASDEAALAAALSGCDAVVHAVVSDPAGLISSARALAGAARLTSVPRVIYLSSAMVHGTNPANDYDEDAPMPKQQPFAYAKAKIAAEKILVDSGIAGLTRLRPGIVYGPRSRWISESVESLSRGGLAWIDGGRGICPAIYVDNLIRAIEGALASPAAVGQAFLVRDAETVTWRDFYTSLAHGFGLDERAIAEGLPTEPDLSWRNHLESVRVHPTTQRLLEKVPNRWKQTVKGALAGFAGRSTIGPGSSRGGDAGPSRQLTDELTALQRNQSRLIDARARALLGYIPPVTFAEGMARSVAWAKFSGWEESFVRQTNA